MINLLLAILFSSLLYIVFKFYSKFNINTFQAIVFNYVVAFLVGIVLLNEPFRFFNQITQQALVVWKYYIRMDYLY